MARRHFPGVSVVIPVYNSAWILGECLGRLKSQDYPAGKVEILIADGGSTDGTLRIARELGVKKVYSNPLKTGEAGKAVAVSHATREIIALIDSDNLLPDVGWLKRMTAPFADPEIFGTEPWEYTWRRQDGFITRYCALLGMNDPLCLFLGNYDRRCALTGRWTGLDLKTEDRGGYLKVRLRPEAIPTVGANGFMVRRADLLRTRFQPYLFDIDCVCDLVQAGRVHMAKVKTGIIHLYARNAGDFARKQRRRVKDYLFYQQNAMRRYPWRKFSKLKLLGFILASLAVLPTLLQAARGFARRRDIAWFFHPLACLSTLAVYGWAFGLNAARGKTAILSRDKWNG